MSAVVSHSSGGALSGTQHHFGDTGLPWLFAEAFLVMGGFVTLYNYIGFRLLASPFNLSQTAVGAIFIVYLVGSASPAWAGHLAGRFGRRKALWLTIAVAIAGVGLTVSDRLVAILAGMAVVTAGFFGAHSVASKALGGENHLAPRVINTDEHAGYPPAIVRLKSVVAPFDSSQ